jgi:dethiobiotin synthetase
MSPHASAAIDGVTIRMDEFQLPEQGPGNHLVVEGAGGLLVPLNEQSLIIDLIKQLNLTVLLVARSGLGTLNHTLLSISELRRYQIPCLGVVLNGEKHESNRAAIEHYGNIPVIGELEPMKSITHDTLKQKFNTLFDGD